MASPPLVRFLRSTGKIQHHLHTIVVGLVSVETGIANKPGDLDIAWKPSDVVGSAREARRFVIRATLILIAEELKEYATQILRFHALAAGTALTVPKKGADRIRALVGEPDAVEPTYLTVAPLIVSNWRNRIVHRNSRARLTSAERERILANADSVRGTYKNVEVDRLLKDFEADQPTLKDVTALLAMSIKFVRIVDSKLALPNTAGQVRLWVETEGLMADVLNLERKAANGGSPDPRARARQYLQTKSPTLAEPYYHYGIGLENDGEMAGA